MEKTLNQWIKDWDATEHGNSKEEAIELGFYDWFCKDSSLMNHIKHMVSRVKQVAKSPLIDADKVYVWFKNNCPMDGNLYNDFRIADIATGDVLYTIVPYSGHRSNKGETEVWGKENDFEKALVTGTWADAKAFFGTKAPVSDTIDMVPPKPAVKLIGEDGNVFNLLGICARALDKAGQRAKSQELIQKVTTSGSYDEALMLMNDYVDIR